MSAWIANGSELTQRGRTNLREAVRCTLLAGLSVACIQGDMAYGQEAVGTLPTLTVRPDPESPSGTVSTMDAVRVVGFMVTRESLTAPLSSLNPGSARHTLAGMWEEYYLGPLDTHVYEQPLPPVEHKNPQPQRKKETCPREPDDEMVNNPVDITSGTKHVDAVDFQSISIPELKLSRYKNPAWEGVGIFGKHWTSNFDVKLTSANCEQFPDRPSCVITTSDTYIRFRTELGGVSEYEKQPNSSTWIPTSGQEGTLTRIGSGPNNGKFVLRTRDSISSPEVTFRSNGQIERVVNKDGNNLIYSYDAQNRLLQVTHASGRNIRFTWTSATPGTVTSITDPNGGVYTFEYQPSWGTHRPIIRKVNYPDGKGNIEYIGGAYIDQIKVNGQPFKNYTYHDAFGPTPNLVKSSSFADGTNVVNYQFFKEQYPEYLFVTRAETVDGYGKKTTYLMDKRMLVETIGDASVHCAASVSKATYTDDKLLESTISNTGTITKYEYDGQRRRTKQIEAFGTPQQRITTWEWDDDPNNFLRSGLIKKVTVQGHSAVTYTYRDLDGLVATMSSTNLTANGTPGATRTTSFSYTFHSNGLIASVLQDGPLPGTGDYTKTTYSAQGDLISQENALGQVKTYSGHNGFGQPARFVDISGAVVEYEYDARGRVVVERTFPNGAPVETRYVYGATGLLDGITSTDGNAVYRHYDSAHRLIQEDRSRPGGGFDVKRYTYDQMSNPIRIEVGYDN
jgi:YD repeat-containing protein